MTKKLALAAATLFGAGMFGAGLFGGGMAQAQPGPNLIEMRQVAFSLMSGDFGGINAVIALKGDVKTIEGRAKAIARYAAIIPAMFPAGTAAGNNTKALPEVFSDSAGFQKAAMGLGAAATKLSESAKSGDVEMVAADAKAVGAACGVCHNNYRAK
jgi:cytochrome c556